ncbi:MAG: hypothetical protein LQ348_006994 [Seirophora lacunosa]|nr:MAG: hypothetical protein LQ348_006994 [Seirophora lacunosa]
MDQIGQGGSARIQQSPVNIQIDLAFKRLTPMAGGPPDEIALYRALTTEIGVLGHRGIADHPNILKLEGVCWDTDSFDDKVYPVLVFEKAAYGDLTSFRKSDLFQRLDAADKMLICAQVANAVASMHSFGAHNWYRLGCCHTANEFQGVVHGDIKPSNVLIHRENNDTILAKVADFGFSALASSSEFVFLPQSIPWNAPEWHWRGFTFDQAIRQDVYSFGLLCLWLLQPAESELEGTLGFEGKNPSNSRFSTRNDKHLEDVTSMNRVCLAANRTIKSLKGLSHDQENRLLTLFDLTLSSDPSNRTNDMRDLFHLMYNQQHDIWINAAGDVPEVIPPGLEVDFKVGPNLDQFAKADHQVRRQILHSLEEQFACFQNPRTAFEIALCSRLGFGGSADERKCQGWLSKSERGAQELDSEIDTIRSRKQWQFASKKIHLLTEKGFIHWAHFSEHRTNEALRVAEVECVREVADMQNILGETHLVVLIFRTTLALLLERQGRLDDSLHIQKSLVADFENDADYGPDHASTLTSVSNLAHTLLSLGRFEEAELTTRKVYAKSQSLLGAEAPYTLVSGNNLATALQHLGRYSEASKIHESVLQTRRRVMGVGNVATLTSMNNYAQLLSLEGKFDEAEKAHIICIKELQTILGFEHPFVLACQNNLAEVYESQGRLDDAEKLGRTILQTKDRVLGPRHPSTLNTLNNLALVLQAQKRLVEAKQMQTCSLMGSEQLFGTEHPATLTSIGNLASILDALDEAEAAETMQQRTVALSRQVLGEKHPDTLIHSSNWAWMLAAQRRMEEANDLFQCILATFEGSLGDDHYLTRACRESHASMVKKFGEDSSENQ